MKRTAEKGFSEATGTAEKYIFVLLGHPIDECCFVYINALSCDEVAESLYSHRINSFHHGLCFFFFVAKLRKVFEYRANKKKKVFTRNRVTRSFVWFQYNFWRIIKPVGY